MSKLHGANAAIQSAMRADKLLGAAGDKVREDSAPEDLTQGVSLMIVLFSQDPMAWQLEMMKDPIRKTG
jgi:hypothetical protein